MAFTAIDQERVLMKRALTEKPSRNRKMKSMKLGMSEDQQCWYMFVILDIL